MSSTEAREHREAVAAEIRRLHAEGVTTEKHMEDCLAALSMCKGFVLIPAVGEEGCARPAPVSCPTCPTCRKTGDHSLMPAWDVEWIDGDRDKQGDTFCANDAGVAMLAAARQAYQDDPSVGNWPMPMRVRRHSSSRNEDWQAYAVTPRVVIECDFRVVAGDEAEWERKP